MHLFIEKGLRGGTSMVSQRFRKANNPYLKDFDRSEPTSYIQYDTNLRKNAKSDFEKDLYKLMNNSVFGKTMENVRNRINVNLVRCISEENKIRKFIARPSFAKAKTFDQNLVAIHLYKTNLKMNRLVYVGMSSTAIGAIYSTRIRIVYC